MRHFFVTGTDTSVGKTHVSSWLLRQWRRQGLSCVGLKPIATGDRADAEALAAAADHIWPVEKLNPLYFSEPAAPFSSARQEGRVIDLSSLSDLMAEAKNTFPYLLVEGVGGWRVPLAPGVTVQEWAQSLDLPILLVARAGLGTLNHTLLTLEAIANAQLTCVGVILNHGLEPPTFSSRTNAEILGEWTSVPVWEFTREREESGAPPPWLA
jgi:dethiobiotin synthetase